MKAWLDRCHKKTPVTVLIQGGAPGADYMAKVWAQENGIKVIEYLANWKKYGKKAGPLRNAQMIEHGSPELCIGFPGGGGTRDMLNRAIETNIWTIDVRQSISIKPKDVEEYDFKTYMSNLAEKRQEPPEDA